MADGNMMEKRTTRLGPWTDEDLALTATEFAGAGADEGLPTKVRFVHGVTRVIRRRRLQPEAHSDAKRPAVFLLEPNPKLDMGCSGIKRAPMLDNGLTQVSGRIWFVSAVPNAGRYVDLGFNDDDDALFCSITEDFKLGHVPAIIFDPRTSAPTVRYYESGLEVPESCRSFELQVNDLSLTQIFQVIDHIYRTSLVTPEAQIHPVKLWRDSSRCLPDSRAEYIVQAQLKVGLATAFPSCIIRHEQVGVSGRLDLEIEEPSTEGNGEIIRHAILELKVLRSQTSNGVAQSDSEIKRWVQSGLDQALAYRVDRQCRAAALCCFDMRAEDIGDELCFAHIKHAAAKADVALRRWYIYSSSKKYRKQMSDNR
ncbi:hypothetical protein [Ectothiorhodospira sp. BSL-9]|uniref:hypothetical protein n=1 Tax=Ectothiorhodospira sp. BSL-9 TaxID=1442136 RepID=UPI0012E862F6|nr:hypothetical protein [Ectothiorhodospira sp. BSL-9]